MSLLGIGFPRSMAGNSMSLGGLGGMTGLPVVQSTDPTEVFYTTNEPIESIPFLEKEFTGAEAYTISPLVQHINNEVKFPRGRLPTDFFEKLMRQINSYLPPCSEKRTHIFKHARVRVKRSTKEKLANRPKTVMTSVCIYCKQDWSGLKYPLQEDSRYPPGLSIHHHRRKDSNKTGRPDLGPSFRSRHGSTSISGEAVNDG